MKPLIVLCCFLISSTAFAQGLLKWDKLALKQPMYTFSTSKVAQAIPQDNYTKCFGFFCRQELKMQQAHVPVTFRLGSMDYCNWLEQKPGCK